MDSIIKSIIRTVIAFLILSIVARLLGRKSISQMTFFDFSIAITLGSVTANVGLDGDKSFKSGITVLMTLCILGIIFGFLHINSFRFRKLVNSEPVIVINNGELVKKNMKKVRLTLNKLTALLREKNYFNISDVNFAILENNGEMSVLPKADKKPLTPIDMQIHLPESGLTRDLIIDGNLMNENLIFSNLTEKWLLNELKNNGINSIKSVFYAAVDSTGKLYISKGDKKTEHHGEYGIE